PELRPHSLRRARHHRDACAPRRPSRPRALVPAHQRVPGLLAPRQCLGRGLRLRRVVEGAPVAARRPLPRGERAGARRARRRRARGQGGRAGAQNLARRAAPARARARARRGAARAAARRAGGRPLARGDEEARGAGARAERALHHRADRAQDGHHHERLRPRLGDALRQPDRRRHARRDPARSRSATRVSGWSGGVILEIIGIDTFYGLGHILHGLSLNVAEGEVVTLLGRNGAGKTTTLRSITGLTPPRAGEIRYKGRSIAGLDTHRISQMGIALVPETRGIFSYLNARENLLIAQRKHSRWQMDAVLERFPALRERLES